MKLMIQTLSANCRSRNLPLVKSFWSSTGGDVLSACLGQFPSPGTSTRNHRSFSSTHHFVPPEASHDHDPSDSDKHARSTAKAIVPSSSLSYPHMSSYELIRAGLSLSLCQWPWLVHNASSLLNASHTILGKHVTEGLLKATLYGHFCAGQDEHSILPTMQRLKRFGIGTILDFAAEQDDVHSSGGGHNEAVCDQHADNFVRSIRAASVLGPSYASVATHVSSLTNPASLETFTTYLEQWQRVFQNFERDEKGTTLDQVKILLADLYSDGKEDKREQQILGRLQSLVDPQTGIVDLVCWMALIQEPKDMIMLRPTTPIFSFSFPLLTDSDVEILDAFYCRGRRLAQEAVASQCRLFIDAEQVRYQLAIDHLVWTLQQEYNAANIGGQSKMPVIFGTIQCYRKDALNRLAFEVKRSQRFNYSYGVKLVRGAYMESERALAALKGVPSPIHDTLQDTHNCYTASVDFLLQHVSKHEACTEICLATHNANSIDLALSSMKRYGVNKDAVVFAQLYGMSDHLTFSLAQKGSRAFKYVPYGQVHILIPYLIRRAQENSSIAGGARDELGRILKELRRRLIGI